MCPRKFGYDVSVRPPVRKDAGGGGGESEVSSSGEEYVIAEVPGFCIPSTSLVSAVNHRESFFPLNFNVYINLDNGERARAKKQIKKETNFFGIKT